MNLPESLMLFLMMAINCFGMDSLMLTGKTLFRVDSMTDLDFMKIFRQIGAVLLMLLLVPALNLSGMISGRMEKRFARDRSEKSIWSNVLCLIFTNNLGEPDFDCYWRLSGFDYILWNGVII